MKAPMCSGKDHATTDDLSSGRGGDVGCGIMPVCDVV